MTAADRWMEIDAQNRIHLRVVDAGSDVTLVLWCGLGSTADSFLHFLREGSGQGVNVVAIDPPGHGQSPVWTSEFSAADAQRIWRSALQESPCSNSRQVWIGGHSYGAYTAIMALPVIQDRIAGLVLLDGAMQGCDVLSTYRITNVLESELPALLLEVTEPAEMEAAREAGVAALGAKLSRVEVVRVHGGHDLPVDNPAAMTEAVWTFLNQHR